MIRAGWFEDDALCRRLRQPSDQRLVAAFVVFETPACAVGHPVGVEMIFRDIDADGIVYSFPRLCLSFGALPRVSVQAKGKDEGDQTLTRPVKRSAVSRSDPRR